MSFSGTEEEEGGTTEEGDLYKDWRDMFGFDFDPEAEDDEEHEEDGGVSD